MNDKPIENCYWVVPGKFLAGEYPRNLDNDSSVEKMAALREGGVVSFIDLTEEGDRLPYTQWLDPDTQTHHRFPIRDINTPDSPELTTAILDAIDDSMAEGNTVYLHCMGALAALEP